MPTIYDIQGVGNMVRRRDGERYPEFHVTFVKDRRIAEVTMVSLADLGFANDVAYPQQPINEIPKDIAIAIEEEFIFLIEELLPRNIQDLFYKIGLDPRPAYWKFFEIAGNDLGLEKYMNLNDNRYNQFITHAQDGILECIELGWKLSEIYENTCVTKTMIMEVVEDARRPVHCKNAAWEHIEIEAAIFKQNLQYERNVKVSIDDSMESTFDFLAYRDGMPVLGVTIELNADFIYYPESGSPEDYEEICRIQNRRAKYCKDRNITLLRLNEDACFWNDESWNKIVSMALKDSSFAKRYEEEIITLLKDEVEDWDM